MLEVLPPLDWEQVGRDSWSAVFKNVSKTSMRKIAGGFLSRSSETPKQTWDGIFRPVRRPGWWQGDSQYHTPAYSEPASDLERRLIAGEFVVTCETSPPLSSSTEKLLQNIE